MERKEQIIVVKIGSSTITRDGDPLNRHFMADIADQTCRLLDGGIKVAIVSSGAVACGRENPVVRELALNGTVLDNQVLASLGQVDLIAAWRDSFRGRKGVGQLLFKDADFLNGCPPVLTRAILLGIVPIINANDAVTDEEMRELARFGDNDVLACDTAIALRAKGLISLTDEDGVRDEGGYVIPVIKSDLALNSIGDGRSVKGTGGMRSKVATLLRFADIGGIGVIANGYEQDVLLKLAEGKSVGTRVYKKSQVFLRACLEDHINSY